MTANALNRIEWAGFGKGQITSIQQVTKETGILIKLVVGSDDDGVSALADARYAPNRKHDAGGQQQGRKTFELI